MKHNELLVLLINRHSQKYPKSCSPSLIEIMLKYFKLVPDDFYELQDNYKDQNVGLTHFANKTIKGLHIEQHNLASGESFVHRIKKEWANKKMIGLYCVSPNQPNGERNCHGWIVSEILGNKIFLLSKFSEDGTGSGKDTAMLEMPLEGDAAIEITDVIVGTPIVANPSAPKS